MELTRHSCSGVVVTPHVAALTFPEHVAEAFLENIHLYLAQMPLKHVVNMDRGY